MSSPPALHGPAAPAEVAGGGGGPSPMVISNGVLLAAVIFLFMVVVFVFLLYLYAKRYLGANPMLAPVSPSSRFLFLDASPFPRRGLPAAVLRGLPVTVYAKPGGGGAGAGEGLECAVCLSEVADGEKVRLLPKCEHGFHVECIDMWFHSHDTCPLCRAPVGSDAWELTAEGLPRVPREEPAAMEFPMFPTNVLFWGTHDDVANHPFRPPPPPLATAPSTSSSASGRRKENLVIDIPTRSVAADSVTSSSASTPLPASRMSEDMRSPVSARLRSLRRLLSRGKQAVVGPSFSPRGGGSGDIEQGLAGADAACPPKTPKTPPAAN
ncbi:RING-H2 finger protein ATL3-like [Oryza brachyantha]|uniref:RING-H2 finger protein ATL3-like n=1 Tax=Oryza brachyantha TaxID=4533 RepID=UPI001ADC7D03|nr:RING-H2 finger protein ATL3-like [Oryza brachyantha]